MADGQSIIPANRRDQARRTVLKGARIVFNDRKSTIDCRVRDLSADGARLDLPTPQLLPHTFELQVAGSPPHRCGVRWAQGTRVGVCFLDEGDGSAR
jgi:hypothetical protein